MEDLTIPLVVTALIALIAAILVASIHEEKRWQAFSAQHHCRMISHMNGNTALTTGISSSGKLVTGTTYIPGKDGFLCDDGITYYRDN